MSVERKIIALSLAACLMAASCKESHLDGSSQAAFDASVMRIGSDLSVPDAQELGARIQSAEKALGPDVVRRLMDGMSYSQAKVFLEKLPAARPPPS